jgi:hypothetical protein
MLATSFLLLDIMVILYLLERKCSYMLSKINCCIILTVKTN